MSPLLTATWLLLRTFTAGGRARADRLRSAVTVVCPHSGPEGGVAPPRAAPGLANPQFSPGASTDFTADPWARGSTPWPQTVSTLKC